MAKRLSSIFSLGRDDSTSNTSQSGVPSQQFDSSQDLTVSSRTPSPHHQKLTKHRVNTTNGLAPPPLDTAFSPLGPPPLVTASGVTRMQNREVSGYGRSNKMESPPSSREGSRSRPQTPVLLVQRPSTPDSAKSRMRRSFTPGKSPKGVVDPSSGEPNAWVAGLSDQVAYDLKPLLDGHKIPELWDDQGDTLIYLFPRGSSRGASIKTHAKVFSESRPLTQLLQHNAANITSWDAGPGDAPSLHLGFQNLSINVAEQSYEDDGRQSSAYSTSPARSFSYQPRQRREQSHLYTPLDLEGDYSDWHAQPRGDDLELLVLYRNFFAFLTGGALISTPRQASLYTIFLGISSLLKRYSFTSEDESTFGEVAASSFARYCAELRLADVRSSREKTIEAIVLGEHMKDWALYNEGFVHAAGRLDDIKSIKSPKFAKISAVTANRLERATIDIKARLLSVSIRLEDFDFPSMFSGIANSQTSTESKLVRFKEWKLGFTSFRRHVVAHYRHKYGAWPPKANSKKHNFEETGLNRMVLKQLYTDFCDLYDMLVDRTSMTTRTIDLVPLSDDVDSHDLGHALQHALRQIEGEYDRSGVPVHPPVPYDVPVLPTFMQSFNRTHASIPNSSARSTYKLKDNEVNEILLGSYNRESIKATSWIQDFIAFERRMGHGKTLDEIVDMRIGQWLFMYAILQSLPMTVVDARDLQFTDGVEYFLCIPSRGGRPWMKEDTSQSRAWYNAANGFGAVSLPADLVDHSIEGTYRRSHCWTAAAQWAREPGAVLPDTTQFLSTNLQTPATSSRGSQSPYLSPSHSPHVSPHVSPNTRPISNVPVDRPLGQGSVGRSWSPGPEANTAPSDPLPRPISTFNPNTTFDSILGTSRQQPGKKGKK